MAEIKQVELINKGVEAWNRWRQGNPDLAPNLMGVDLSGVDLKGVDFSRANLAGADLKGSNLSSAILSRADLSGAVLRRADFTRADLSEADLSWANLAEAKLERAELIFATLVRASLPDANLSSTNLSGANLIGASLAGAELSDATFRGANLSGADLSGAHLRHSDLTGTNLSQADLGWADLEGASFGDTDLSTTKGLDNPRPFGPFTIGIDTLFKSDGKIPEAFLLLAGIPEDFLTFIPSFVGRAIEFYSCFISYSHRDEDFSNRLHSRMRSENIRVWYAPEHMKGGRKLHEEVFGASQIHDKLLLVLSEYSMTSEWVISEIRRARKVEREENRRKLFPIRLVSFDEIKKWECFDSDTGKDLAVEVREFYIPDFSNWKDHDSFEKEFAKLLRDLKATEIKPHH
jgi:uncharacterized protein YjbI with pentapeptide repeats